MSRAARRSVRPRRKEKAPRDRRRADRRPVGRRALRLSAILRAARREAQPRRLLSRRTAARRPVFHVDARDDQLAKPGLAEILEQHRDVLAQHLDRGGADPRGALPRAATSHSEPAQRARPARIERGLEQPPARRRSLKKDPPAATNAGPRCANTAPPAPQVGWRASKQAARRRRRRGAARAPPHDRSTISASGNNKPASTASSSGSANTTIAATEQHERDAQRGSNPVQRGPAEVAPETVGAVQPGPPAHARKGGRQSADAGSDHQVDLHTALVDRLQGAGVVRARRTAAGEHERGATLRRVLPHEPRWLYVITRDRRDFPKCPCCVWRRSCSLGRLRAHLTRSSGCANSG